MDPEPVFLDTNLERKGPLLSLEAPKVTILRESNITASIIGLVAILVGLLLFLTLLFFCCRRKKAVP